MLQRIHQTGYLEYNISNDRLFMSKLIRDLSPLDLPEEIDLSPLLLQFPEESKELFDYVEKLKVTTDTSGVFEFISFASQKNIKITWIKEHNKIFGAISYLPELEV